MRPVDGLTVTLVRAYMYMVNSNTDARQLIQSHVVLDEHVCCIPQAAVREWLVAAMALILKNVDGRIAVWTSEHSQRAAATRIACSTRSSANVATVRRRTALR